FGDMLNLKKNYLNSHNDTKIIKSLNSWTKAKNKF
ncbi:unnamed protein product, partial [marine sediment metagenome]